MAGLFWSESTEEELMPDDVKVSGDGAESSPSLTLIDLLRALERSQNLRELARECGLSVRELRRRLANWNQEMVAEMGLESSPPPPVTNGESPAAESAASRRRRWPELTAATELRASPLPRKGPRVLEVWTDGASRGNPGPAAIGIVFRQKGGEDLCSHFETIGRATNNEAEYQAVITALEFCRRWRVQRLHLFLDSELIVRQLRGEYRVKSPTLQPLYQRAVFLARGLQTFVIQHVPREENQHADALANRALSRRGGARSAPSGDPRG
jgi:ribonuclease HI